MCKFTNRLFVFALLGCLVSEIRTKPLRRAFIPRRNEIVHGGGHGHRSGISTAALLELLQPEYDDDYDLLYDQRQKGAENVRLKMDGLIVGLPSPEAKPAVASSTTYEDLLEVVVQDILGDWLRTDGKINSRPAVKSEEPAAVAAITENIASGADASTVAAATQQDADDKPLTEIIVEIPAHKKDSADGHHTKAREHPLLVVADDSPNWPRTKGHVLGLLNLLRRQRNP